jgi:hypothetical protein
VLRVKPEAREPKSATKVKSDVAILLLNPSPVMTKLGLIAPAVRLELVEICGIEGILETVTAYVVVLPSCAVTKTEMLFSPTLSDIDPEADPEVTLTPPIEIVALESLRVGVTVMDDVALETIAV